MHTLSRTVALLCLAAGVAGPGLLESQAKAPEQSAEKAMQAMQMLPADQWAQAIKVRNDNHNGRYPGTVYATVFELDDSLWFYTATGAREMRRSRGNTDAFKDDLLPLLRRIDRGFRAYQPLSSPAEEEAAEEFPRLSNGCVIESIYMFDRLTAEGTEILEARILLYSSTPNRRRGREGRPTGHAVLVYETPSGIHYIDPPELDVTGTMTTSTWEPEHMAKQIEEPYGGIEVEEAFFIDFPVQRVDLASTGK